MFDKLKTMFNKKQAEQKNAKEIVNKTQSLVAYDK